MIKYDLRCDNGDEFEAWFGSISDYDKQAEAGLVECPHCGSKHVEKAPMAPAVQTARKKSERSERAVAMAMAAKVREHIKDNFDYVGDKFADEARKMHSGESEERAIWGEATPEQAQELAEEGISAAPLPAELAPVQPKKLN
ncbi:DUF1178 family protein [Candidatus Viadribacter manganicus]|uniref:Uncharacterized protein n=1 Tax=Candidatus Viadribacter manganicus TaxID=1759059 RepID=A0A1B1AMR4_9PROT|nr:DUF1178 family protein [Candidatus Viadribacter manganicus]ANP47868.1 hypothetical protein ATE48_19175 [Candidatus Viadribacter manganicus]